MEAAIIFPVCAIRFPILKFIPGGNGASREHRDMDIAPQG